MLRLGKPLKYFTLVLTVDSAQRRILLGMKKRGFGANMWNGFGGKIDLTDASTESAALRELQEECGVVVPAHDLHRAGTLYFDFGSNKAIPQVFHVALYRIDWTPELAAAQPTDGPHGARAPYETEEMRPQWFDWDQVPFDKMWDDDRLWFPWLLRKEPLTAQVWFDGEVPAMVRYVIDVERTGERVVGSA
ncbi:Nudix (Nucleoside diphosphate linked moiety X)-type motif 1 [Allomyces arbusculus]|nr:Nudix (Nucleoside diphosphate linked moiety X)-type motif 1 [Allomyces arbusculus]